MHSETITGLHKCQARNTPEAGTIKNMVVLNMPAKNGKKAWIKITNKKPEEGGSPYRILNVQPLDWPPDQYGNVAMNLEVEATTAQPTAFANARATMQQGEPEIKTYDLTPTPAGPAYKRVPEVPENVPQSPPHAQKGEDGVTATRKHLMQSANLYNLCVSAVDKAIAPHVPAVVQTSEMFQAAVASLYIEASKDVWWSGKIVRESWLSLMPTTPLAPNL